MDNDLTAIILAAGDSTRLWPVEDKLFLNFAGIPLIQYPVNQAKKIGINKFILVCSPLNEANCRKLADLNPSSDIEIAIQKNKSGMAGAVLSAAEKLITQRVLIIGPTDIVEDYLFSEFRELYKQNPDGILVGKKLSTLEPLGYYSSSGDIVTDMLEKPEPGKLKSDIAAIVFDYFRDSGLLINKLKNMSSKNDDIYEKAKIELISEGMQFKLLNYNGYWGFLKYPWHILSLTSHFLNSITPQTKKSNIDISVKITGPVIIEDNVTILENVKIVGPAIIGKGTFIGQNSLIRESMIGQNCIIGFSCEISRSYVGDNCWFHQNFIGDSVIMDNVTFGFGAVVANFRLDGAMINSNVENKKISTNRTKLGVIIGKNSRIGVNASLMPGIKIGSHSIVGSSVAVTLDLPENKYIELKKNNTRILDNRVRLGKENMEINRKVLKI